MASLPLELEHLIFKLAATEDTDHDHRVQLSLVAKRVYEWIRPIIYRVAIANGLEDGPIRIPAWRNAQLADVAQFTRHLLIVIFDSKQVLELLATFRNVEDLAIWPGVKITSQIISSLNGLPLRMLSADLSPMPLEELILQGSQAFGNLTHLEILDWKGSTKEDCKALETLPKLTHLCFGLAAYLDQEVVDDLLMHCSLLEVLICAVRCGSFDDEAPRSIIKSNDTRCVVLGDDMRFDAINEWERSANGYGGLWELGEVFVERNELILSLIPFGRS